MSEVKVVSAVRTLLGRLGGILKDYFPVELGSKIIKAVMERINIDPQNSGRSLHGVCALGRGYHGNYPSDAF